jgi:hypothetical protein
MENIIAGAFGLLIGTVGVWVCLRSLKNHRILNRWPTTKGQVIERGTYQPNIPYGNADAFRYAPLVKYVYQVAGKEFTNKCINPARIQTPTVSSEKWAEREAALFPDEVIVHYNTENPGESFLILTSKASKPWLYIVVAIFSLMILFVSAFYILLAAIAFLSN